MRRLKLRYLSESSLIHKYNCLPLLIRDKESGKLKQIRPTKITLKKGTVIFEGFHPKTRKYVRSTVAHGSVLKAVSVIH